MDPVEFALLEKIDAFADSEMVPVFLFPIAAAELGYFFKRGDEGPAGAEDLEHVGIGLAFEITDEIAKNKTKIDQHEQQQGRGCQHAEQVGRSDRQKWQETVKEVAGEDKMGQGFCQGSSQ